MRSVRYVCLFVLLSWSLAAAEAPRRYVSHKARVPNEYIVVLDDSVPAQSVREIANRLTKAAGGRVLRIYDLPEGIRGFAMRGSQRAIQKLLDRSEVRYIEENARFELAARQCTSEPSATTPGSGGWGLNRISQRVAGQSAHGYTYFNSGVTSGGIPVRAYVLDSGVYGGHDEFAVDNPPASRIPYLRPLSGTRYSRVVDGFDATAAEAQVPQHPERNRCPCDNDTCDNSAHGTAVASILGGKQFGVAKDVQIVPVRVTSCQGGLDTLQVLSGLAWSAQDAARSNIAHQPKVLNMSFSGDPFDPVSPSIADSISRLIDDGVTVIVAAGNFDLDACTRDMAQYAFSNESGTTGRVISVGMTRPNDDASYCTTTTCVPEIDGQEPGTNSGRCVDLFAPGYRIRSASDRIRRGLNDWVISDSAERTRGITGTSFAAPAVAGAAARLLAEDPSLMDGPHTSLHVWNRLRDMATLKQVKGAKLPMTPNRLLYIGPVHIRRQPKSSALGATLDVEPLGATSDYQYQWFQGKYDSAVMVGGATASTFTPTAVGQYWVRVSRGQETECGSQNPALVDVYSDSAIADVVTCALTFSVAPAATPQANGSHVLSASATDATYEWFEGPVGDTGDPVGTGASITVSPASPHQYWVRATNASGCSVSGTVIAGACTPVAITGSTPSAETILEASNNTIRLGVTAVGTNRRYHWYRGTKPDRSQQLQGSQSTIDVGGDVRTTAVVPYWAEVRGDCAIVTKDTASASSDTATFVIKVCNTILPQFRSPIPQVSSLINESTTIHVAPNSKIALSVAPRRVRDFEPIDVLWRERKADGTVQDLSRRVFDVFEVGGTTRTLEVEYTTPNFGYCWKMITLTLEPSCALINPVLTVTPVANDSTQVDLTVHPIDPSVITRYEWREGLYVDSAPVLPLPPGSTGATFRGKAGTTYWVRAVGLCETPTGFKPTIHDSNAVSPPGRGRAVRGYIKVRSTRPLSGSGNAWTVQATGSGTTRDTDYTLEVPVVETGAQYRWFEKTPTASAPVELEGNLSEITRNVTMAADATPQIYNYYVVTKKSTGEESESQVLTLLVEPVRPATVTIEFKPSQSIGAADVLWLDAKVDGLNPPYTYTWHRVANGIDTVFGGDNASVSVVGLQWDSLFRVHVQGSNGSAESQTYPVTVACNPAATVTTFFDGGTAGRIAAGQSIVLSAFGLGKLPVYMWYRGISDPTQRTTDNFITIGPAISVSPTVDTDYLVWMEDACGNTAWATNRVRVCIPTITQHPQGIVVKSGTPVELTVAGTSVSGGTLTYKWYTTDAPGTAIHQAQNYSFVPTAPSTNYFATVTSSCATVYSNTVTVDVCSDPVITSHTAAGSITNATQTAHLVVAATGKDLTYQWYRGTSGNTTMSTLLAGETSNQLTIAPTATTNYWCRVTSQGVCTTDTPTIPVNVCRTPQVDDQPDSQRIFSGATALLTVVASEALGNTISYQWYEVDGTTLSLIPGATSASYTTPPLTANRSYQVKLTAGDCSAWSEVALISICTYPEVIAGPSDRNIAVGESTLLQVNVSPAYDKIVTWYQGESGVTTNPIGGGYLNAVINVSPTMTTKYWAKVEHDGCISRTTTTTVSVCNPPNITTHPQSTMIDKTQNPNASTTLTLAATGANLTYQWYYGQSGVTANPVPGATSPSLTVSPNSQTSYWARVSGSCGVPADSNTATVILCQAPAITAQPMSIVAAANVATQIEVTATGTNLSYAWYRGAAGDTTNPVGGNSPILPVSVSTTTQYWVRVSGTCGSVNSNAAFVSIAPAITTQPVNYNTTSTTSATFSVVASGSDLSYQWFNSPANTAIAGATAATYTTPALTQDTSYYVRVTSGIASVTSNTVTAVICQAKNINVGQSSTRAGSTVALSIVSPDGNQTYTWYQGAMPNTAVSLGTGTAKAVNPDVTTQYWALNSGYGCYSGKQVTVTVCEPRIATQPAPAAVTAGQNATMSVVAAGPGPFTYQWYAGASGVTSSPVNGQTTATLSITATSTQTYWVRVTGSCGTADSNAVQVTVCQPPAVTVQPVTKDATANVPTQIEVQATGTGLNYAWFRGTVGTTSDPIGTNSNVLTVTPVDTRQYWARITGSCGTVNSAGAWINVAPVITTQPVSMNVTSGTTATFSVVASGTFVDYQWFQSPANTPISGATGTSYTTPALTSSASYYVRVRSGSPSVNSNVVTATVCQAKAVNVSQPSQVAGSAVTLSIVSPDGNQSYMWYQGAVGNTSNNIGSGTAVMVYPTQTTQYWVLNAGYSCSSNSQQITVNVCYPRIDTQPQGAFLNPGQSTTLTVAASGTPALTYQWYYGVSGNVANPVPGATSASLTVSPASTTNYWVRVTSAAGSGCVTDSATALVRICTPPAITLNPAHTVIYPSETVTLGVTATGDELTYQWYEYVNNTNVTLTGQTSSTLVIQPGTTRKFWVRVTGRCGYADSIHALQSVRPQITTQPADGAVCSGNSATFSVGASGSPDIQYRWHYGPVGSYGTLLGSNASVTVPNVTSTTTVWCEVSSGQAFVSTQLATATVQPGPPVGIAKTYMGWSFTYTLTASVPSEVAGYETYQWYRGPLSNTASSTTGPASQSWMVDESSSTHYWVRVIDTRTGCRTDKGVMVPW